jgi:hypothetical protein
MEDEWLTRFDAFVGDRFKDGKLELSSVPEDSEFVDLAILWALRKNVSVAGCSVNLFN